jgi:hypothetical protein
MQGEFDNETEVEVAHGTDSPQEIDITEAVRNSPILSRLVEEVRIEQISGTQSYNRMHNRHNRSR